MTPSDSVGLALALNKVHKDEVDLRVSLAKYQAGAKYEAGGGEVR